MRFESCSSPLIRSLARTLADRTSGRAAFQLLQDETWALRSACQEPDTGERVLNLSLETPRCPLCAAASCSPMVQIAAVRGRKSSRFCDFWRINSSPTVSAIWNRENFLLPPTKALERRYWLS